MENLKVGNSLFIKDLNLDRIFKLIHKLGPVSRKELVERTDYSAGTISNHVKTLMKEKFVIETEKGHSTGGRKPVYLTVNPDKRYLVSVEIAVSQITIVIFNLKLNIVTKSTIPIKDNNPDFYLIKISNKINEMLKENCIPFKKLMGIGIAVPGLIKKEKGILDFAPNLGWENINIVKKINMEFDIPVILENEANASAVGEKEFVFPESNNLVFVSVNEGIGCGIIINGQLFRGCSGNAGEFGHIIIDSNGPKCHCGNNGCWETLASENFILSSYKKNIKNLDISKKEIYFQAKQGNKEVLQIFRETGKNLGVGLINIVNSLSPELVIIGGGIIEIEELIFEDIKRILKKGALDVSYEKVDIKFSKLNNMAAIYGMASLLFKKGINFVSQQES